MKLSGKKIAKYTGITIGVIIVLLILATLSLRLASVQNFVKDRVITFVEDKIGTPVSLDRIYVKFPNELEMHNFYLEGQKQDTILKVNTLEVGLNLWDLLDNQANLTSVEVEGLLAYVKRDDQGKFNFDYIIDAFATEDDSESKPFILNLNKIDLNNIRVNYDDRVTKNNINVGFNKFQTVVKKFDLDQNSYAIDDLTMDGLRLKLKQDFVKEVAEKTEEKVDSLSQQNPLQIELAKIDLTNFDVEYDDDISQTYAHVQFQKLFGDVDELDIEGNKFVLDELELAHADIVARLNSPSDPQETVPENTPSSSNEGMQLFLKDLSLEHVNLRYDNTAVGEAAGMDYNHLAVDSLNFEMNDFEMLDNHIVGKITKGNFKEKSGFVLKSLETDFQYTDKFIFLEDLLLETNETRLEDNIKIAYDNIEQLSNQPGKALVDIQLQESYVGFKDIRLLAPSLSNERLFRQYPNAQIRIDTDIQGAVDDMDIKYLRLSGPDNLKVNVQGKVWNATQPEKLSYNLNIEELTAQANMIYAAVEPGTIPSNIRIPHKFSLRGTAKGNTQLISTDAMLTSTDGNAKIKGDIDLTTANQEQYDVHVETHRLNMGKIIQNKDLGTISVKLDAKGVGFDPNTADAHISGTIQQAEYNGYNYQQINIDAALNNKDFSAHILSHDPNADLELTANGHYAEDDAYVSLNGAIVKMNLHRLGFYDEPMIIAGNIEGEARDFDVDNINATIYLKDFALSDTEEIYPIKDATLEMVNNETINSIQLESILADAKIEGKYNISEILPVLAQTINSYYEFTETHSSKPIQEGQYFDLTATIKDNDVLHKFVPDLQQMEEITLDGTFDADDRNIDLRLEAPFIVYQDYEVNHLAVAIGNTQDALQYQLNLEGVKSTDFALDNIRLNGEVKDDQIHYHFKTANEAGETHYLVGGVVAQEDGKLNISLNPDELILNYDQWQVSPDNSIILADTFVTAKNFNIQHGRSQLSISSVNANPNSPLALNIKDFDIETLTQIVEQDSLLAQGTINGNAVFKNPLGDLKFDADVQITNLKVYGSDVGNVEVALAESSSDRINTHIQLSGFDNKADISGYYDINAARVDLDAVITRLNMESLQGFTMNEIQQGTGYLSGDFTLRGELSSPEIRGNLAFNDVGLFITQLGTKFQNINDHIEFNASGILFDHFQVYDDSNNLMELNGKILTSAYEDFDFDLTLEAENFKVVDADKEEGQMLYGVLAINTDLAIKGDIDLPIVTGNLEIDEPTDFTYIMPQSSPTLKEREGVVRFVDKDQVVLNETIKNDTIDTTSDIRGLDVSVNITVQPEAKLSMIIDQATGDFVKVQGTAELTGSIDPSGKTSLTGVYEVEEGAYELNFNLLQRRFDIQKGSTITWNGDPMEADIDITAIYELDAAPIDLLEQQISGLEPSRLNQYKQRIPFNTILKMRGDLMKPEITFDITMDKEDANVAAEVVDNTETKLSMIRMEQNEINKQVFSLLLLNRFMGENPFASNSGMSAESVARQSVSRILSDQLNNLASDLIQGVELNFELESRDDYTTGERQNRTDLNVSLSKRLLNDRLEVTVGNNFGIEGDARANEEMANIAGDITLDYSLSKDGTYILRAYRSDEYQVALQGQVVETGVGFIITLEYNEFKEIFERLKFKKDKKDKDK